MVAYKIQGYTTKKLEHLSLFALGPPYQAVLAYLLQESHLPTSTMLLGTLVDYLVL